jgi:predicted Kef-type K+ transport protein
VLSLFVLVGGAIIIMWLVARLGYGERTAFLSSVTLAQVSEFSFIFAAVAVQLGFIDDGIMSLIAVVGLVTIGISSYMIQYNHQLYVWISARGVLRIFRAAPEPELDRGGSNGTGRISSCAMRSWSS